MLDSWGPGAALLAVSAGLLLICAEFCLTGWVVPGVAGGVLLICGVFRMHQLGADARIALTLLCLLSVSAVAGYRLWPLWTGWVAVLAVPAICRWLIPGAVGWGPAAVAGIVPAAFFVLLRIAARGAANKTLLE
jgi:membrane-bound ClpP family serine protease